MAKPAATQDDIYDFLIGQPQMKMPEIKPSNTSKTLTCQKSKLNLKAL